VSNLGLAKVFLAAMSGEEALLSGDSRFISDLTFLKAPPVKPPDDPIDDLNLEEGLPLALPLVIKPLFEPVP
jgi:hypothetical protein